MRRGKFEKFYGSKNGARIYYFRLKAGNGEVVCQSEGYTTAAARDHGIKVIKRIALFAKVVDV